jgi:hypothetical protein
MHPIETSWRRGGGAREGAEKETCELCSANLVKSVWISDRGRNQAQLIERAKSVRIAALIQNRFKIGLLIMNRASE